VSRKDNRNITKTSQTYHKSVTCAVTEAPIRGANSSPLSVQFVTNERKVLAVEVVVVVVVVVAVVLVVAVSASTTSTSLSSSFSPFSSSSSSSFSTTVGVGVRGRGVALMMALIQVAFLDWSPKSVRMQGRHLACDGNEQGKQGEQGDQGEQSEHGEQREQGKQDDWVSKDEQGSCSCG
jgi:Flp pilus assembly pilin Flp